MIVFVSRSNPLELEQEGRRWTTIFGLDFKRKRIQRQEIRWFSSPSLLNLFNSWTSEQKKIDPQLMTWLTVLQNAICKFVPWSLFSLSPHLPPPSPIFASIPSINSNSFCYSAQWWPDQYITSTFNLSNFKWSLQRLNHIPLLEGWESVMRNKRKCMVDVSSKILSMKQQLE